MVRHIPLQVWVFDIEANYVLPKHDTGTGARQTFPCQKGEIVKKRGARGPKLVQNQTGQATLNLDSRIIFHSCIASCAHWGFGPRLPAASPVSFLGSAHAAALSSLQLSQAGITHW